MRWHRAAQQVEIKEGRLKNVEEQLRQTTKDYIIGGFLRLACCTHRVQIQADCLLCEDKGRLVAQHILTGGHTNLCNQHTHTAGLCEQMHCGKHVLDHRPCTAASMCWTRGPLGPGP